MEDMEAVADELNEDSNQAQDTSSIDAFQYESIPPDDLAEPDSLPPAEKPRTGPLRQFAQDVAHIYREVTRSSVVTSWPTLEPERDDLSLTQQMETMEHVAENMLEKITFYCDLLEKVRGKTSEVLNQNLPRTFEIIQQLEAVYAMIDRLEKMVEKARQGTLAMELVMDRAEKELRPSKVQLMTSFLKKVTPFTSSKRMSEETSLVYEEPPLFISEVPSEEQSDDQ